MGVLPFAVLVMALSAVSYCVLRFLFHVGKWEEAEKAVEYVASVMDFVGVMYISRGVILLKITTKNWMKLSRIL
ncbi:hypothetical protein [Burkholderia plantarii]|uniref:hypothetical protein n=1 Tax=Burkholderia plantarii TaxID=41899 RepID=UPI000F504D76|nr:hypothetical protein [Burkholderia plantarii]